MVDSLVQIWRHRALAEILVARDLKARYRGTLLGFLWSFANPQLLMAIYVMVFSVYMRVAVPNYAAFVLCGLLPWTAFVACMTEGMSSIISNGSLIKKVHLPSEIFPFVSVASNMVHFLLSVPVLLLVLAVTGVPITLHLLFLPILFVLQALFAYGVALLLATLAVQFRDLVHIIPNITMMWFYCTPVIFGLDMVPERYRPLILANPMSGLVEAYRNILLRAQAPSAAWMLSFTLITAVLLSAGTWLFRRRSELYPELV
jgi:ABC-type polysaccharide/polyol phosphate export permease